MTANEVEYHNYMCDECGNGICRLSRFFGIDEPAPTVCPFNNCEPYWEELE